MKIKTFIIFHCYSTYKSKGICLSNFLIVGDGTIKRSSQCHLGNMILIYFPAVGIFKI